MTLAAGARLGPYEILSPIGAGGMGEVYRARDTRLGREVAVKVLPASFSADPERVKRFEQEAQSASRLNHSNILVVHDIGSHEGSAYIVSELLEGESLREKLGTPMPPRKAVEYAMQVAHGLAAAHEKGIVHRDLKPENLFVTKDGRVKILDFGIAKLTQRSIEFGAATEAPTAVPATEPGVVIGTVPYMSPEQVQGKPLDARSDLFSLGTVLYEMLSGKRPFQKDTAAETMTAILREEPAELSQTNEAVSPGLERIVRHCLEKEPSSRFQSAGDVAFALETLSAASVITGGTQPRAGDVPRPRRRVPIGALGAAATLAAALSLSLIFRFVRTGSPPASASLSLALSFPVDAAPDIHNQNPLALAPDGKTLVYAGSKVFVRRLDRDDVRPIPGTEGARQPFMSPDGLDVGFFAEGKLKKVSLSGGLPVTLCDAPSPRGGSWGSNGTIVFTPSGMSGLQQIAASGGEPRAVTTPDAGKPVSHRFPEILPDGEHVLFDLNDLKKGAAAVVSLRTGEQRIVVEDAAYPRYLPTGHLVFTRRGTLFAVPFSLKRLETSGPPVPLLEDLVTNLLGTRAAEYTFSQEGTLVYVPTRQPQRTLVWVDRKGALEKIPFPSGAYEEVALSPDGGRLAVTTLDRGERSALLFGDLARGTLGRSTAEGVFFRLVWTPDGQRVAFGFLPAVGTGRWNAYWQSADGSTPPERLTGETPLQQEEPTSFSPDGSLLLLNVTNYADTSPANTGYDIFLLPLRGERTLRPFLQTKLQESGARFSPDGRWVAYVSTESGRFEVFVRPFPGPGAKWQISTEGGYRPRWSRNGRELFYRQEDKMMVVEVETAPAFRAGRPRVLFEGRYEWAPGEGRLGSFDDYDVAPDGARFLMIQEDPAESGPAHVKVILNWFDEVKRRVPVK